MKGGLSQGRNFNPAKSFLMGGTLMSRVAVILAASFTVGAAVCILLEADAAITMIAVHSPDAVLSGLARFEAFGHGIGTLLIVTTVYVLCSTTRAQQALLLLSAYGAGILASLIKVLFIRPRPFLYLSGEAETSLSSVFQNGSISLFLEHLRNARLQSFPSAHTAAAFGLAAALAQVAPRGRWWWLVLATGCGLQRVFAQKHFASDVLAGAALGLFWANVVSRFINRGTAGHTVLPVIHSEQPAAFDVRRAA